MATRRPDLEAQAYKDPGFISMQLFPAMAKAVKAGTYYYQDVYSETLVQTDRTLASAPTAVAIASSSSTWSMAELIKRYKSDASEIEQLGGLDAAQAKGARAGKRLVMGRIEDLAITAIFGAAATYSNANIMANFLAALDTAKETVQDYADGRLAIFGAKRVIQRLKRYDEVVARMQFTGVLPSSIRDVRSVSDMQLAAALGVDVVLAGPTTPWLGTSSVYDGWLGVCVLPDATTDADEEIQLGRTFVMPVPSSENPGNIFTVETYYSDDLKSEVVDTTAWTSLEVMNKEACYILKGIDEGNTVTTSTTTTAS